MAVGDQHLTNAQLGVTSTYAALYTKPASRTVAMNNIQICNNSGSNILVSVRRQVNSVYRQVLDEHSLIDGETYTFDGVINLVSTNDNLEIKTTTGTCDATSDHIETVV